jgi:hypothetical protein
MEPHSKHVPNTIDIDAAKATTLLRWTNLIKGKTSFWIHHISNNSTNTYNNGNGEPDDATVTTIPGKGM